MTGTLCILLIVSLSICKSLTPSCFKDQTDTANPEVAIAIPRVNDIPTSIHVCIIGTFLVVAAFILLFSIRLHKAITRYRDKNAAVTPSP
jgi:heme/copper-type cytochrome/quinol oxidase subunit 2